MAGTGRNDDSHPGRQRRHQISVSLAGASARFDDQRSAFVQGGGDRLGHALLRPARRKSRYLPSQGAVRPQQFGRVQGNVREWTASIGQLRRMRLGFLGTGRIAGGLTGGADQLPVARLQCPVAASQIVGFAGQRFGLLILTLM